MLYGLLRTICYVGCMRLCVVGVCLDMFGTLLLVYIMYAWTCYAWLLEHVMYDCHGSMLCMSVVPFSLLKPA
jgi:hypothetical protein